MKFGKFEFFFNKIIGHSNFFPQPQFKEAISTDSKNFFWNNLSQPIQF